MGTFASVWDCASAGDVIVVADGTYALDPSPPAGKSGESGAPIQVLGASDGGAHIMGTLSLQYARHLSFTGLRITGESSAMSIFSDGSGRVSHDLVFSRMGFECTEFGDNTCVDLSDGTHDVVIEDSWAWGGGRYIIALYGGDGGGPPNITCDHNTIRRVVIRQGPSTSMGGNPQAGLALYYASDNLVENVTVVDSQPVSDSSNSAFYLTGHAPPPSTSNNRFFGVIALNNLGVGWYLDHNGVGSNNELRNSVLWKSADDGVDLYADGTCSDNIVDHVTVGASGADGLWNGCDNSAVTSSIFVDNGKFGLHQSSGAGSLTASKNDYFGNPDGARENTDPAPGDLTTDPGLLYIARIEPGSPCSGAGAGGSDCGADIRMRSQDGVVTGTPLWPWPNESRIFREMCTEAVSTRGFCGVGSLTSYVWGYLGNASPY